MTAYVFPLRPGRPLVHRWPNGRWGWTCNCLHRGRLRAREAHRYNCDSWAHALRSAVNHIRYEHKTRAQLETAYLEALYALPPAIPERKRHVRRCAHCREPITGLWAGPIPWPGTHGAAPRFHADREACALALARLDEGGE